MPSKLRETAIKMYSNRTILTAIAVWLLFIPLSLLVPRIYLFELVNALAVATAFGVVVAYFRGIMAVLATPQKEMAGGHYLILGIVVAWFAAGLEYGWRYAWRVAGEPDWMIDHPALAFLIYMSATAAALHLTAKDAIGGVVPKRNWLKLSAAVALALMFALITIIMFGPDPRAAF